MNTPLHPLCLILCAAAISTADAPLIATPQLADAQAQPQIQSNPYAQSGKAGPIQVQIDASKPGITLRSDGFWGTDLAIWNSPERYEQLKPYLVDAGFNMYRFPNGSLSNDYHWNGKGHYDSTGVWFPDGKDWAPGFLGETRWRGTTKDNYGFKRASHLLDGDSTSLWWGALYERQDPPWFSVDLKEIRHADSLRIDWGKLAPQEFSLMYWDSVDAKYPYPHQLHNNLWKVAYQGKVKGTQSSVRFPAQKGRYWAVRFESRHLATAGVQVREFRLFHQGQASTVNHPDAHLQSKAWGVSTRHGDEARTDWTNIAWDFEKFMAYIRAIPDARPVICVNVATGTPEEAAAWVRYANRTKGYQIRDWQIGNENDGEWEEAGPLSAMQYAAKYLSFAKAMKAVDPSIRIHGPLHSSDEFLIKGDGVYSGRSWMETFLATVGAQERKDKKIWLDVVDFHSYPYWTATGVIDSLMLWGSSRPGPMMDTLDRWMRTHLSDGHLRGLHFSEFSSTVVGSHHTLRAIQATTVVHLLGQFATRFGNRGHALPWDTYGSLQKGPDGSMGSMRMANPLNPGAWSSWDKHSPSSQWFGIYLAKHHWFANGLKVLPVSSADSAVRAFALGNADTTRVLLVNMATHPVPVEVHNHKATPVQTFLFGEANFRWIGTNEKAFAKPSMGPWSNRLPTTASVNLTIPAQSLAVIQWGAQPRTDSPIEVVHAESPSQVLLPGDTLEYWATIRQKGGSLLGGKFRCPPMASGEISFADGVAGGEIEGLHLRIPIPKQTKPGNYRLGIELEGLGKQAIALELPFRIRGSYRTVHALYQMDGEDPGSYTYAHGNNATRMETRMLPGSAPYGGLMLVNFNIEQPREIPWPNFAGLHLPVNRNAIHGVELPGQPPEVRTAGIVFDYASNHSGDQGYFDLLMPTDVVKDYDEYAYRLRNTRNTWVRDTVLWSEMSQEGWGKAMGPLKPQWIRELEFRARGEGKGELRLDNIYLLAEDGTEVKMPVGLRRFR